MTSNGHDHDSGETDAAREDGLRVVPEGYDPQQVHELLAGYKAPRQTFAVEAVERFPSGKPDYAWARERALALAGEAAIRASTSSHSPA